MTPSMFPATDSSIWLAAFDIHEADLENALAQDIAKPS